MAFRCALVASLMQVALANAPAQNATPAVEPLANAHSHNDYWRQRPLFDALDRGFTSVEADVFLVDGHLLVGHDREGLQAGKSLESLYLDALLRRARENGGRIYQSSPRFFLLIDIKSDARVTYRRLNEALSTYVAMLTSVERGKIHERAVTVVVSGNRLPFEEAAAADPRYAGLDGRISDLDSDHPAHVMPMISDNWTNQFSWRGAGPMPVAEKAKLQAIVQRAHGAGRVVRFWATPESEDAWRELRSAGVDLINTDELDRLAAFLRAQERARSNP
jgi:glycerophosphoryl diester phosphodiesterase